MIITYTFHYTVTPGALLFLNQICLDLDWFWLPLDLNFTKQSSFVCHFCLSTLKPTYIFFNAHLNKTVFVKSAIFFTNNSKYYKLSSAKFWSIAFFASIALVQAYNSRLLVAHFQLVQHFLQRTTIHWTSDISDWRCWQFWHWNLETKRNTTTLSIKMSRIWYLIHCSLK